MSDERLRQRVRECETFGHVWPRAEPELERSRYTVMPDWVTARWGECQRCGDPGVFYGPWHICRWSSGANVTVNGLTPVRAWRRCTTRGCEKAETYVVTGGSRLINDGIIPPDAPDWAKKALARYAPGGAALNWLSTARASNSPESPGSTPPRRSRSRRHW